MSDRRPPGPIERDRRRAEHCDHADPFRETTRRGPHVELLDLDETHDEGEERHGPLTPVEGIAVQIVNEAADRLERASQRSALEVGVRTDARVAELDALPGSTWARKVDDRLGALEAAAAPTTRRRLLTLGAKYLTGGAVLMVLGLAIRALIAHGDGQATGRADTAMLHRHDRQIGRALAALQYLAGKFGLDLRLDDNAPKDPP